MKTIVYIFIVVLLLLMSGCDDKVPTKSDVSNITTSTVEATAKQSLDRENVVFDSYDDLLEKYRNYVDSGYKIEREEGYNGPILFGLGIFEAANNLQKENFGYGLKDINGDGILDLVLMIKSSHISDSNKNNVTVLEIFSLHNGKPIFLINFWTRSVCLLINKDGTIYERGTGGGFYSGLSSYKIENGGGRIITIDSVSREYKSDDEVVYYKYDKLNHSQIELDFNEGNEIWNKLNIEQPDNSAPYIDFIPLFN